MGLEEVGYWKKYGAGRSRRLEGDGSRRLEVEGLKKYGAGRSMGLEEV